MDPRFFYFEFLLEMGSLHRSYAKLIHSYHHAITCNSEVRIIITVVLCSISSKSRLNKLVNIEIMAERKL